MSNLGLNKFLEEVLPPNAHREVRGKVRISVTELPTMKNKIIGEFNTRKELIKVRRKEGRFVVAFEAIW